MEYQNHGISVYDFALSQFSINHVAMFNHDFFSLNLLYLIFSILTWTGFTVRLSLISPMRSRHV